MSGSDYPNIERVVRAVDGLLGLLFLMITSVFWLVVLVVGILCVF